MDEEQFHISLTHDAKPFCIKTPRSIPFANRDKLKDKLDLLLSPNIITPVTTVRNGAPLCRHSEEKQ